MVEPINKSVEMSGHAYTIRPIPIGDITFDGIGKLMPLPDITPLESVHISIMLTMATAHLSWNDYKEYVERNKLERHFTNE